MQWIIIQLEGVNISKENNEKLLQIFFRKLFRKEVILSLSVLFPGRQ